MYTLRVVLVSLRVVSELDSFNVGYVWSAVGMCESSLSVYCSPAVCCLSLFASLCAWLRWCVVWRSLLYVSG